MLLLLALIFVVLFIFELLFVVILVGSTLVRSRLTLFLCAAISGLTFAEKMTGERLLELLQFADELFMVSRKPFVRFLDESMMLLMLSMLLSQGLVLGVLPFILVLADFGLVPGDVQLMLADLFGMF